MELLPPPPDPRGAEATHASSPVARPLSLPAPCSERRGASPGGPDRPPRAPGLAPGLVVAPLARLLLARHPGSAGLRGLPRRMEPPGVPVLEEGYARRLPQPG